MVNLEDKIRAWRKNLRRHEYFEDGTIAELEDHLRDEISNLIEAGHSESDAFDIALKNLGDLGDLDREEKRLARNSDSRWIPSLLWNYLIVGMRAFGRNKLTSSINLLGLAVAITVVLFVSLFIYDELSFEQHHPNADRIYRLSYSYQEDNGEVENRAYSSGMWIDLLEERSSLIEEKFRFLNISYGYLHNPESDAFIYEEQIYWSDPNFFSFLNFDLKYGEVDAQLADISSIVLTESTALQVFGEENPIGKTLEYHRTSNKVEMVVTGVIYDPPSNSHFQPKYIAHIQAVQGIYGDEYRGWVDQRPFPGYAFTYLKVKPQANVESLLLEVEDLWDEILPKEIEVRVKPLITPLSAIHFNPPFKWEIDTPINMSYIWALLSVGAFIMVIALTNYANLTIAQGRKRQKEMGLRQTLGGSSRQLRLQFFLESTLTILIALVLAFLAVNLLMPDFNSLISKNIDLSFAFLSNSYLLFLSGLLTFILFTAAFLPAIILTRSQPGAGLSQHFKKSNNASMARNALVTIQFTVAITLVIATITVYNQLQLINSGYLGKNRDKVIGIRTSRMGNSQQVQRYKAFIRDLAAVESNTLGMHLPRQSDFGRINTRYKTNITGDEQHYWNKFDADGGFLQTYDLKLLAGRDFREIIEPNALIINKTAAKALNLDPIDAIGIELSEDSINYVYGASNGVVVGVVEDFAYKSIREVVEPLVICANNSVSGVLSVRLGSNNFSETIAELENGWKQIYPGRPFEYWFLDKEFDRMYNQERRLGSLIPLFSGLAIVIAMLGLFTLTIFVSDQRKKEIGIRKVLGSSSSGILLLLGWQFIRTLLPAILMAVPLAYFGMNYWLGNFTYRVAVDLGVVVISVLAILLFAIITISYRMVSAASSNPVDSLRYE